MTEKNGQEKTPEQNAANPAAAADPAAAAQAANNQAAALQASEEARAKLSQELATTVEALKGLMLAANPTIPSSLIAGSSVTELNSSLETAKIIVDSVRERITEEVAKIQIPAGQSARTPESTDGLSGPAKIELALRQKGAN